MNDQSAITALARDGLGHAINANYARKAAKRLGQNPIVSREFLAFARAAERLIIRHADTIIILRRQEVET